MLDPVAKTRPNLVPYDQLPRDQRRKADLFAATALALGCGTESWAVKTLTDPEASQVHLASQPATIAELVALAAPVNPTGRVNQEFNTYELKGTITMAKMEADSAYPMVLNDGQGKTMIIEASRPDCCQGSRVATQIAEVRAALEAQFPQAGQGKLNALGQPVQIAVSVPVTVTGVAFFDRLHGQTGVAPNGIELHPILSFNPGAPA